MTDQLTVNRLQVPGGTVYYEVRGTGPLMLVVGQPMTSGPFAAVADHLATDHTVVTYDPRSQGHSPVDDPTQPVTPEVEADDLSRIITAIGGGPADVVGSSGGAVAGLALLLAHPEQVRTLIAHEPPLTELLPDAQYIRAAVDGVADTYRAHGSGAAWGAFISLVMHEGLITEAGVRPAAWPPPGPDGPASDSPAPDSPAPDSPAPDAPASASPAPGEDAAPAGSPTEAEQKTAEEVFFLGMLKPFTRYVPDTEQLRSVRQRIVVGVGEASGDEIAKRSAVALAEQLRIPTHGFPGHHGGPVDEPEAFAAAVRRVLAGG
jgi:pimeloyl-ACP methyl ester carboxylesterase